MAINETYVEAPPEAVWRVLEDPFAYPRWVVGTDRTLEADPEWPAPGSSFKVHIKLGYSDRTDCEAVEPGRRIVLNTGGGSMGAARVELQLEPDATGTRVTLVEEPSGLLSPLRRIPPVQWGIRLRNTESLRRLKRLAEEAG